MAKQELAILKCDEGLVQLYLCPVCLYFVKWKDVSRWKVIGEVECCKFCDHQPAKKTNSENP